MTNDEFHDLRMESNLTTHQLSFILGVDEDKVKGYCNGGSTVPKDIAKTITSIVKEIRDDLSNGRKASLS